MKHLLLSIFTVFLFTSIATAMADVDKQSLMCRYAYLQTEAAAKTKSYQEGEIINAGLAYLSNNFLTNRCAEDTVNQVKTLKTPMPANKCSIRCEKLYGDFKTFCQFTDCTSSGEHPTCAGATCDPKAEDNYFNLLNCYTNC